MTTQPTEPTHATYPTLSRKQAFIIFIASMFAMIPGWLLGAYIPLWLAPPDEMLGMSMLIYMLLPCLLWGIVPVLIFRLWKISIRADVIIYWVVRYMLLFIVWLIVFLLVFSKGYEENVYFEMMFTVLVGTTCTAENTESGIVTYTCNAGLYNSPNCADEDYRYLDGGFDRVGLGCSHRFTFEGREGLPFVWYTGEIIPEQSDAD